jgi:transposase
LLEAASQARKGRPCGSGGFQKNLTEKLAAIAKEHPSKRIEPWFEDEARFGQQGTLTRVWARRGCRPGAVKQTGYEWLYVLAAVCPSSGESVGLLSPYADGQVMNIFLHQFSQQLSDNIHAVLIWDQAGFHKSKELRCPSNISLIELPAYSPELNPVENLWQYFRGHYWANRSYAGYDDLRVAACNAWQNVCLDYEHVRRVCRCTYLERTNYL